MDGNNGPDMEVLASFVRRYENLQAEVDEMMQRAREECDPVRQDMAAVKREANDAGFGKKEFAAVLRKRRLETKAAHVHDSLDLPQRANFEQMMESLERLAEQVGPLGEAALEHARAGAWIEPTQADIGRRVIYTGNRYPGGQPEHGIITSFNSVSVFVRYGSDTGSKGTNRCDLEWERPLGEAARDHARAQA